MSSPRLFALRLRLVTAAAAGLAGYGCTTPPVIPEVSLPAEYKGDVFTPSVFVRAPIPLPPAVNDLELMRELRLDRRTRIYARIEYVVGENGTVIAGRVVATNHPVYANALLAKVSQVRFVPGSREGKPVKVRLERTYGSVPRN